MKSKLPDHDELVFKALSFYRNVGADLDEVRRHLPPRARRKGTRQDQASLRRLERAGDVRQVGERWFLTSQGAKRARGNALWPDWRSEDGWILLSLFLCAGAEGADLSQIIGAADYIDHGIPTLGQLHGALNRLAAGRLIKRRRGRFFLTDAALVLAEKVRATSRSVRSQRKDLLHLLECPICGVQLKRVRWNILLDQSDVDEAHRRYVARFRGLPG